MIPLSTQNTDIEHRKEIIEKFIVDVSKNPLDKSRIRKKFIYPIEGERSDERIELIDEVLTYFNKDLGTKDLSKFAFVPFSELPQK